MTEHITGDATSTPGETPNRGDTARVEAAARETARESNPVLAVLRSNAGRNSGLVVGLLLLCIVGAATAGDRFTSTDNALTILRLAATTGVVSIGMTFVITGGGIDLSVGAILALSSVWCTTLATQQTAEDSHWIVMVFVALAVGAGCGLVNGLFIAYGGIVPFIMTLAMLASARGLAEIISDKKTQIVQVPGFADFFDSEILGIEVSVYVFALVALVGWVLLNRTTFGRRTIAVGGNPEAARLAGINVKWHTVLLYALSGLCCGLAAIMLTSQATSAQAAMANLYELDAIAAAIIGGTLLSGGRGTIIGALFGVLVFSTITNLFAINNLSTEVQNMVKGGIIVAAVLIQQFRYRSLTQLLKR